MYIYIQALDHTDKGNRGQAPLEARQDVAVT